MVQVRDQTHGGARSQDMHVVDHLVDDSTQVRVVPRDHPDQEVTVPSDGVNLQHLWDRAEVSNDGCVPLALADLQRAEGGDGIPQGPGVDVRSERADHPTGNQFVQPGLHRPAGDAEPTRGAEDAQVRLRGEQGDEVGVEAIDAGSGRHEVIVPLDMRGLAVVTDAPSPPPPETPGWYDDPEDAGQLRYFDGILWTRNVTPRRTATVVATPPQLNPAGPAPATFPAGGASTPGAHRLQPTPAYAPPSGPRTADGVPLAGYGARAAAYVMDAVLINILAMILGGYFLYRAVEPMLVPLDAAMRAGDAAAINATANLMDVRQLGIYTVIKLVIALTYQLVFLTRWSATPGKLIVGISVRRVDRPGVLSWDAASRRAAFLVGVDALTNLPLVSLPALVVKVVDLAWPLSDQRRQAWHDKVADTVVVQGRQSRQNPVR